MKVESSITGNTWGADLTDMKLTSKFNREICFLLCAIDIFSKHAWLIPLKDKKKRYYNNQCFSKKVKRILSQTKQNMDR